MVFMGMGTDKSPVLPAALLMFSIQIVDKKYRFAFPALYTIDRWGRRRLLLATFPMLAGMLLLAGLCSLAEQRHVRVGLVTAFVFIYTAFYSTGEGPVPFTYSAEAFPLSHRGQYCTIVPKGRNLTAHLQKLA